MDVLFLGTPEFALATLQALLGSPHRVVGVVTPPDRPRGRGRRLAPPPVKVVAAKAGLEVLQTADVNRSEALEWVRARAPEAGVVVAFGQFLKRTLREMPAHGFVNLHASLLPRYRGAAPIHAAVMAGEERTGVSIMRIERRLDAGPVYAQEATPIGENETTGDLEARLADLGARLMMRVLAQLEAGEASPRAQDEAAASYAPALQSEDRWVRWDRPAPEVHNRVRGLSPRPGAVASFVPEGGEAFLVRLTRTACRSGAAARGEPGRVAGREGAGLRVAVADGEIVVLRLVPAGGRELDGAQFLQGRGRRGGRFVRP